MPVENCIIDETTIIWHPELSNIYGVRIGANCNIGANVSIGPGVVIGDNCRIQERVYIPTNVVIEDGVFLGPGVVFTNDPRPWDKEFDWRGLPPTVVKKGATICAGALILPNLTIGEGAVVGAGAVVTKDIAPGTIWHGVPARNRRPK